MPALSNAPVAVTKTTPDVTVQRFDLKIGATVFHVRTVGRQHTKIRHGWACIVSLIYEGDNDEGLDPDRVSSADVMVVTVGADTLTTTSDGLPCLIVAAGFFVPVVNLHPGDAIGLDWDMDTWHQTEQEARRRAYDVGRHLTGHGIEVITEERP